MEKKTNRLGELDMIIEDMRNEHPDKKSKKYDLLSASKDAFKKAAKKIIH